MNLSLARDILKRIQGVLDPPGCCSDLVEHPAPWMAKRMAIEVGVVIEHRFAFYYWLQTKKKLQYDRHFRAWIEEQDFRPPDLLTMDWHDDVGGECDFIESELRRLNQRDENEVGFFCWAGLRSLDDGHIAPAMWLNAVGNVYVVAKQHDNPETQNTAFTDRYGREHAVFYFAKPDEFVECWNETSSDEGLIWDLDLDYFTDAEEVPDQRYTPMLSDEDIAELLDPEQDWVQAVLANLRGITVALEPKYTGGLSRSCHLFKQWEKAFFQIPLFDKRAAWKPILR